MIIKLPVTQASPSHDIPVRLRLAMQKKKLTCAQLARASQVKTSFLYDVLSGKSSNPSAIKLKQVATALGVELSYLVGPDDADDTAISRQHYAVPKAIAPGSCPVAFRTSWLEGLFCRSHEHLRFYTVNSDNMEPTLKMRDCILVDTKSVLPSPEGIFLLQGSQGMGVKRIAFKTGTDGHITLSSDNACYLPEECCLSDISIIGRVIWLSRCI